MEQTQAIIYSMSKYKVIIVRGAPGMGKSTIGELLRVSDFAGAVMDIDEFRAMVNCEEFKIHQNEYYYKAIDVISSLIREYLKKEIFPIFITDVMSNTFLSYFLLKLENIDYLVINLYSDFEKLKRRMSNRNHGFIDLEIAEKLNTQMKSASSFNSVYIDTSQLTPKETLNLIKKHSIDDK